MSLLTKIKSVLGLGEREPDRGRDFEDQTVTFGGSTDEGAGPHESATPAAESERAVKEPETVVAEEPTADAAVETAPEADAEEKAEPAPEAPDESAAEPSAGDDEPVTEITGIGPTYGDQLAAAGIETVGDLAAADPAEIEAETGLSANRVSGWIDQAQDR